GDDDDDDKEVVRDDDKDDEKDDKEKGGDDEHKYDKETRDEESFDPIPKTPENDDDKGNGEEDIGLNVGREEGHEEEEDELYKDVNTNQGRGIQATLEVEDLHVTLTPINPDGMESIFETTSQMDAHTPTSVAPLPMTASTMTPFTIATITTTSQAPILPTIALRTIIQDLPNFGSLTKRNDEFLKSVDANIQKIIKEQVKEQVKVQVFKILPRIEHTVNEQLEAEVLTRLSHSLKTSYAVATDFSEMELKKILIEKMKGNKSIQRSDEQQNLYKALVEAYESNKIILHTYGETVTLKRRHDDDADKDEEPFAGPDWGSKRRRDGKEPEEDPHAHIRWFNKIMSTIKYKDVPNTSIKLMLSPFSIEGAARIWLEKEPPRSIATWEDLVSKFINQFFPPSKTINLRNEITNFQQRFDESFYEAWEHFKDLLRACPHHGFTKLHQLDTFYNSLTSNDQDSLNAAAGGNLLTKTPMEALTLIENAVKALLHKNTTPPPFFVKAVKERCVTCGGPHPYYQCLATDGNTSQGYQDI
nr:reverse transcriptase domain-containing protein [Tanacetum cinerariifolium]